MIRIIRDTISREELKTIARNLFGDFVKAVVDIKQKVMAVGGELHADGEVLLIEKKNSKREDTWGINLYPQKPDEEFIEFDSMINIKPRLGNRSRGINDPTVREKIKTIVNQLVSDT